MNDFEKLKKLIDVLKMVNLDNNTIDREAAVKMIKSEKREEDGIHPWRVHYNSGLEAAAAISMVRLTPAIDDQLPKSTYGAVETVISRIEEARDKDKIAEYPYNRCIAIIKEVFYGSKS